MLYALFSQTVVTHLDTIETMPRCLGWHCTLIISSVIDCDRLHQKLYGNQQILVPEFIIIHCKQNFFHDSCKCHFSGIARIEG